MFKIRDVIFQIAVIAGLSVVPASAEEVVAGSDGLTESAAAANHARDVVQALDSPTFAMMQPKPKTVRVVAPPLARPAAVSRYSYNTSCSWSLCGRQFVLMIGVAY